MLDQKRSKRRKKTTHSSTTRDPSESFVPILAFTSRRVKRIFESGAPAKFALRYTEIGHNIAASEECYTHNVAALFTEMKACEKQGLPLWLPHELS